MHILAAIDGSTASEAALAAVANHYWQETTTISLVSVLKPQKDRAATLARMKQGIDELARHLTDRFKDLTISAEAMSGDPKTCILEAARQRRADLIVMGTKNKSGIDKLILGSVSQSVLAAAPCPVLIVKAGPNSAHLKQGRDFTRILIASDTSMSSRAACAWLSRQGWSEEAVFKVVTVLTDQSHSFDREKDPQKAAWMMRQWGEIKHRTTRTLEQEASLLGRGMNREQVTVDVLPGEPRKQILGMARGWRAELVVTGCSHKRGLEKLLTGSVSQAIAASAPCSVLIIKGLDEEGRPLSDKARAQQANKRKKKAPQELAGSSLPAGSEDDRPPFTMM
ncbi:MAG: universal stress protein [Candidatus Melainabacteria bacterium]|nr:universal stress protein [Candidatus Melainabacteria bacterium]